MKSFLNKLIVASVILSGWIIYDRWEMISHVFHSTIAQISTKASKTLSSDIPDEVTTTTVYKWKDKKGDWQFSNTKPINVPNTEIKKFRSDENIIPSVSTSPRPNKLSSDNNAADNKEKKSTSLLESITDGTISDKINEVKELKKTLETPKIIPTK